MKRSSFVRPAAMIFLICAVWFALGTLISNPYYRLMLTNIAIWATLAASWNIFSGYSGLVSFGHATFFGIGAFTVTLALNYLNLTPWLGIPLGTLIGALAALGIGYLTFSLRGIYFALAMLAYPLALAYVFEWLGFSELTLPINRVSPIWYMQFSDYLPYLALALGLLALAMFLSLYIERTRFGLSLLAIKQNELAAEAAGIDTYAWKMRAITLSGALAAAAGGLYATVLLVVTPANVFGLVISAEAMVLSLFGGAGTLWGPLIGSLVLVPLSEGLRAELAGTLPGLQGILYGAAIIFVILLAPEGIYWRLRDLFRGKARAVLDMPTMEPIRPMVRAEGRAEGPLLKAEGPLLKAEGISKRYGGLVAVNNVSFTVAPGEVLGIIGPNGAGKTTLFNLLNGIVSPTSGKVEFDGRDITGQRPSKVCAARVGRTFQTVRAFARMSLMDNVLAGAFVANASDADAVRAAELAIARVGLSRRAGVLASGLTNKELRLMELARALAGNPKLILMDEPLAGLGGAETEEVVRIVRSLPADGVTVVIIEHTMKAMVSAVDRFLVLDHGELLVEGAPSVVTQNPKVIEAYLGRKWAKAHAQP